LKLTYQKFLPVLLFGLAVPLYSADAPKLTNEQIETFLLKGKIGKIKNISSGVTSPKRATLNDGTLEHDAEIQCIDEAKARFEGTQGVEMNFKDTWKYNVAGYRLGKILGIADMFPPSVERKYEGNSCAFTWWVNDTMTETDRISKKLAAPDPEGWNTEMYVVRVFDQLIYNTDRNTGNLLIDPDWHIWMIDHTRAFRTYLTLKEKKDLEKIDRNLLAKLRTLDVQQLNTLKPYLSDSEIKGIIRRRDLIVQFFDDAVKQKGETEIVYNRIARP
jgi:hypothetical protein